MEATITRESAPLTRRLASGKVAVMELDGVHVAYIADDEDDAELYLHDRYDTGCECEQDWSCPLHAGQPTWIETRYSYDDEPAWAL